MLACHRLVGIYVQLISRSEGAAEQLDCACVVANRPLVMHRAHLRRARKQDDFLERYRMQAKVCLGSTYLAV